MSTDQTTWHLFDVYGVEVEYMIVDRETLAVRAIADEVLRALAGEYVQDIERDAFAWSNEIVCHLLELKTNGPAPSLGGLVEGFPGEVRFINECLAPHGARLLGTGAHPLMAPEHETRLWPHGDREIYHAYDRIFGCRGHGWSNLQSVHLNLPFAGDEEFGRLHAAIRLVLPIIPALSASTPILDGQVTGYLDTRLETYRHNQDRIPSIAGRVIPERAFSEDEYRRLIFDPIERDIRPLDPDGVLEVVFLNSRGAIARFDRNAIEIRVIDTQEAPAADLAVLDLVVAAIRMLVDEGTLPLAEQQAWPADLLADIFLAVVRDGDEAIIADRDFLHAFGIGDRRMPAGALWQTLANRLTDRLSPEYRAAQTRILRDGPLARRLLRRLGPRPSVRQIQTTWGELADCLADNRPWP
jgi:gamma-glutamyl:cysteine ligase YbdK (ATP-grasp superfamily)